MISRDALSGQRPFICLFLLLLSSALAAQTPVSVRVALLSALAQYPESSGSAYTVSLNDTPIAAKIDAEVVEITAKVGDVVKAQTLLAKLNCRELQFEQQKLNAEQEALQARLALSEWHFKQIQTLTDQQTVPVEQLQEKRSLLAIAKSELASNQVKLAENADKISHCKILAPFDGVIAARSISIGQNIQRGTPVFRLLDISQMEISAQIPVADIAKLTSSSKVFFLFAGEKYPVKIRTVLPLINAESGTQEVRLDFVDKRPVAGAAGRIVWQDNVMHIPAELLVKRGDSLGVFLHKNGSAHFAAIPNAQNGRAAETTLPANSEIITLGHFGLNEGDRVAIAADQALPDGAVSKESGK